MKSVMPFWKIFSSLSYVIPPQLKNGLPYRYFDDNTGFFHNENSIGFGKSLTLLGGANDEIINHLHKLVLGLPTGSDWDYQFIMQSDFQVAELLEANARIHKQNRQKLLNLMANYELDYAKFSASHGFASQFAGHFYGLRCMQTTFYVMTSINNENKLRDLDHRLAAEFMQIGLFANQLPVADFLQKIREFLYPNRYRQQKMANHYNESEYLHQQIILSGSQCRVLKDHLEIGFTPTGEILPEWHQIVMLTMKQLPLQMRLYEFPEFFASLLHAEKSIHCPFRISVRFCIPDHAEESRFNEKKITNLTKLLHSPMRMFLPFGADELAERQQLQRDMHGQNVKNVKFSFCVALHTNAQLRQNDVFRALATMRGGGSSSLELVVANSLQIPLYLSSLPFTGTPDWWKDASKTGLVHKLRSNNLINFFPIITDRQQLKPGVLLPTMRGIINFYDPFSGNTDNFNLAVSGTSGSGKSFFVQQLVRSVYARGGKVWILDKGESYRKLTCFLQGKYLAHNCIFLNPFTHLERIIQGSNGQEAFKQVLGDITGLLATMASPSDELASYVRAVLEEAIIRSWNHYGTTTLIDHVRQSLLKIAKEQQNDRRILDLAFQLEKYTTQGIYGEIFNRSSSLNPATNLITLELEGFADHVRRPVIFALMVVINQQMYLAGKRSVPKLCIIEEAWALMQGNQRHSQEFIRQGFCTARKFGGSFCTVTQGIENYFESVEGLAAFNNCDTHITFRQNSRGLKKFIADYPDHFSPFEQQMLARFPTAKQAGYSCCMIHQGGNASFHRLFADPRTRAILSTDAVESDFADGLLRQGMHIEEVIECIVHKFYANDLVAYEQAKR